jgi:UDP-N-acetylglucosamine 1-carboxyvinyltransferase
MVSLIVEGGRRLEGKVTVAGNKNAALPLLAACLLTDEECVLENVPAIRDVEVMAELLKHLGAEVHGVGTPTLRIRCAGVRGHEPSPALVGKLRGSVLVLGPLLARSGRVVLAQPGGDFPSKRSIGTHIQALQALGAHEMPGDKGGMDAPAGLKGASFYLDEASVTGTETALLAAARASGATEIRHAACEPHVAELARFLRKMGADVTGEGTPTLRIRGATRLGGATHRLDGDYIEAGSFAVLAALTGGVVDVVGAAPLDMEVLAAVLTKMGVVCRIDGDRFSAHADRLVGARRITSGLWPGFPSDMVSLVTVLASQCEGATLVHDWLYELRLFALDQLAGMGADLFLCDPHRIIVNGPRKLRGRTLDSRDIRSGISLIGAALCADGMSRLSHLEVVERGYANICERLSALGAQVTREEEKKRAGDFPALVNERPA